MNAQKEALCLKLIEADMKAADAGICVSPMSRVHAEYLAENLLELGVMAFCPCSEQKIV
jgi:hypothetical protein